MSEHISVLLKETIDLLDIREDGIYADLTLGRAGTSSEILKRIPRGHLYCFDLDEEAISESRARLEKIASNFTIIHSNYAFYKEELAKLGVTSLDGLTADLGVSSPQFDEAERGFSYMLEAPLDMRMDQSQKLSAYEVVNTYTLEELTRIFRLYGEDNDAYKVAKAIVNRRVEKPIALTTELAEIIKASKPYASLKKKGHPAKQIFQAIRIEVNGELSSLERMLSSLNATIAPSGRVAIITFHSLEDRLVKEKFRDLTVIEGSRHGIQLLPSEIKQPEFLSLTRKPIVPSDEELLANHRASSSKLRGIARKGDQQ